MATTDIGELLVRLSADLKNLEGGLKKGTRDAAPCKGRDPGLSSSLHGPRQPARPTLDQDPVPHIGHLPVRADGRQLQDPEATGAAGRLSPQDCLPKAALLLDGEIVWFTIMVSSSIASLMHLLNQWADMGFFCE